MKKKKWSMKENVPTIDSIDLHKLNSPLVHCELYLPLSLKKTPPSRLDSHSFEPLYQPNFDRNNEWLQSTHEEKHHELQILLTLSKHPTSQMLHFFLSFVLQLQVSMLWIQPTKISLISWSKLFLDWWLLVSQNLLCPLIRIYFLKSWESLCNPPQKKKKSLIVKRIGPIQNHWIVVLLIQIFVVLVEKVEK